MLLTKLIQPLNAKMTNPDNTHKTNLNALIIDHNALVQAGLRSLVKEIDPTANIILSNNSLDALNNLYKDVRYDFILLNIDMPDMDGMELLRKISIHSAPQGAAIIVISSITDPGHIQQAKSLGATGFLPKNTPSTTITQTIRSALKGSKSTQFASGDNVTDISQPRKKLNKRQLQILQYLAQGMSNKEISQTIFLSEGTIKNHITQIFNFLGVSNRTQAIIEAEKLDLIQH